MPEPTAGYPAPSAWTLAASSSRHQLERAEHPAIRCEGRVVTYRQLHLRSNQIGYALRTAGIGPGSRVGFLGKESEQYYTVLLACAKLGAVAVPVNWRLTPREVDHILRDSGAELLMFDSEFASVVEQVRPDLPGLQTTVQLDEPADGDHGGGLRNWMSGAPDDDLPVTGHADDPVVQIYTSGTSGLPKGVVLANRSFFTLPAAMAAAGVAWIDWRADDVNLISLPGLGIAGIGWFMHGFNAGATNVIMRMFDAALAVRLVREHAVTTTFLAPAMLQLMLSVRDVDERTFRSLRKVAYGAAPISESLLNLSISRLGCELVQIYSSTEAGSVAVCLPPSEHWQGNPRLVSAGRACPGNELKVVDEAGASLPAGEIGQVCIRTPARMLEYWNQPVASAAALRGDWLHMGDLGYLDEHGYLYLCDRMSDTIIVAGQNIYPAEVERQLGDHPDVSDVAVVGTPDPQWGDAVHACVIARPGSLVTPRQLILFLRGRLADYKIPTAYTFVDHLPRNPSGKILRREVRQALVRSGDAAVPSSIVGN